MKNVQKMSIFDYQKKYTTPSKYKNVSSVLVLVIVGLGLAILSLMFLVFDKVYTYNKYAGYIVGGILLIIFILFYVINVIKITASNKFMTNVNVLNHKKAKKYNAYVRKEIAKKILEINDEVEDLNWYDLEDLTALALSIKKKDNTLIKDNLTKLYNFSVKKTAKQMIFNQSLKCGIGTGVSQSSLIDSTIVLATNFTLVKDIIYLYGFRPSDEKLTKIFIEIIKNTLVSYGVSEVSLGKIVGNLAKPIPYIGELLSNIIDSTVQGLTNAALTATIGYRTINYLMKEYKLQDLLDNIDEKSIDLDLKETLIDLEEELKKEKKLLSK